MPPPTVLIGLECGGTRTVALAATPDLRLVRRVEAGPANLRLVGDDALAGHFAALAAALPPPAALGVGMAGVRDPADCRRVERILERVWPGIPRAVDHDLESALAAADLEGGEEPGARVVILSGTGSCCYGRARDGRLAKVGGWGHHLGDRGSAYDLAHTALRLLARHLDHTGRLGHFGRETLRQLQLNEPNDLIAWFQSAGKEEVAALAPVVFRTAGADPAARQAVEHARVELAADALACARLLAGRREAVEFVFAGSVLLKQPAFARRLGRLLQESQPGRSRPLRRESAWGAVAMARRVAPPADSRPRQDSPPPFAPAAPPAPAGDPPFIPRSRELSPTERRHPGSAQLDRMPLARAIDLMLDEEGVLTAALRAERASIGKLVRLAVRSLGQGGRLFYVGAGTSGRLGVLDASECPPTFRTDPGLVQGIMAGGLPALHSAVEGAEDDPGAGRRAIAARGVGPRDLVVGLAASGRTPFVWGALDAARAAQARTALVCFNPHLEFARGHRPGVVVAVDAGPEILTGSTRLKAGTGTKRILNLVTTLAMVRLGKVIGNLMVDLNPSNVKLRDRACRIVVELTGCPYAEAHEALERDGWVVSATVRRLGRHRRTRETRAAVGTDSPASPAQP